MAEDQTMDIGPCQVCGARATWQTTDTLDLHDMLSGEIHQYVEAVNRYCDTHAKPPRERNVPFHNLTP